MDVRQKQLLFKTVSSLFGLVRCRFLPTSSQPLGIFLLNQWAFVDKLFFMGKWCEVKCNCSTEICVHKNGILVEFWQGDLMKIGKALDVALGKKPENFQIFRCIATHRNYTDECLRLTPDDVVLWRLEIEQLRRFLSGEEFMGWHEKNTFERYLQENPLLYGDIEATLNDGLRLCEASVITSNPIELCL